MSTFLRKLLWLSKRRERDADLREELQFRRLVRVTRGEVKVHCDLPAVHSTGSIQSTVVFTRKTSPVRGGAS